MYSLVNCFRYGFQYGWLVCTGYGFVDFEIAEDAERAVAALQSRGIQAQMAKVRFCADSSLIGRITCVARSVICPLAGTQS